MNRKEGVSSDGVGIVGGLNGNDISSILVSKYDSINSRSSLVFFNRLRENDPLFDQLHLILGGDGYHRSEMVKSAAH